jgi:transposase
VQLIMLDQDMVVLVAAGRATEASCPACGMRSGRVHDRYLRHPMDQPWRGWTVRLRLQVRRFVCLNPACPRATFAEDFGATLGRQAHRTTACTRLLTALACALGGEAGARLAQQAGVPVSPDTLLRLEHHVADADVPTPRVLGVDDWARRRGRTYGTILVDLERHRVVDLLPDRTAETLAHWLEAHPGVEIISRDRASAYADGARQGAPAAIQVADRWHLLKNVGDALERFLLGQQAALRRAQAAPPSQDPAGTVAAWAGHAALLPDGVAKEPPRPPSPGTVRREARYAQIIALHAARHSIRAIARQTELSRMTVRKYLRADGCPGPPNRVGMLTSGAGWERRARALWDAGEHNAAALWRALRGEGFPGSAGSIRRHAGRWRPEPGRRGRRPTDGDRRTRAGPAAPAPPPSPRQVRWWLLQPAEERTAEQRAFLDRLRDQYPAIAVAQTVVDAFSRMVRDRDRAAFDGWLATAEACGIAELAAVATFMRRDYAAIVAALTLPWSNGQTEGQVTRLKLIKRRGYGRASFGRLRRRVLAG